MIRGKKGFIFGLYLVLLTILMMGVVTVMYLNMQKNVNSSLVSPIPVLEVRDNLTIFELREERVALETFMEMRQTKSVFGTDEYAKKFRELFIEKVFSNNDMKNFLLADLAVGVKETDIYKESSGDHKNFYSEGNNLVIKRSTISKKFKLPVSNMGSKIGFPSTLYFDFSREFKVNEQGVK